MRGSGETPDDNARRPPPATEPSSGGGVRQVIDLGLTGLAGALSTHVILEPEPALVDPGPETTLGALREGLAGLGLAVSDLRHLLLTHVHLDHAGAAGALVAENPELLVHLHHEAAPHMADPERLVKSVRRSFGERHDELWGQVRPVSADRLRPWLPGSPTPLRRFRPFLTPGHTGHHLAFLDEGTGTLYAGDALCIVLHPEVGTHSSSPPPGIDLLAWAETLDRIDAIGAERAALQHFGVHEGVDALVAGARAAVSALAARVRTALAGGDAAAAADRAAFADETRARHAEHLEPEWVESYFGIFGAEADWDGVRRAIEKGKA